ncbi:MAG: WG repeat-containing protein [Muribaculaceae bacterium]
MKPEKGEPKYGYIDKTGTWIAEPQFDYAGDFREDVAAVEIGGKYGYIDKTGFRIIEPRFDDAYGFHDGIARVIVFK